MRTICKNSRARAGDFLRRGGTAQAAWLTGWAERRTLSAFKASESACGIPRATGGLCGAASGWRCGLGRGPVHGLHGKGLSGRLSRSADRKRHGLCRTFPLRVCHPRGSTLHARHRRCGGRLGRPPALVADVERGARLSAEAFGALGRYAIDNVTFLIIDDDFATSEVVNHGTGGEVLGAALSDRGLAPGQSPECLISIYALAAGATDGSMATTVAHELFHCLQGATYPGQSTKAMATAGRGGSRGVPKPSPLPPSRKVRVTPTGARISIPRSNYAMRWTGCCTNRCISSTG